MPDTPQVTEIGWLALVLELDPKHYEPETVYKFSNNRKFKSTDQADSGIYEPEEE